MTNRSYYIIWMGAVFFYGFGDLATTWWGTRQSGIEEANPVTRRILGANPTLAPLAIFKIVVLIAFYSLNKAIVVTRFQWIVPTALAGLGLIAIFLNGQAILRSLASSDELDGADLEG